MRNYWMKILIGALVIFAIGMIGVSLVRHGMVRVNDVVHGSGPLSIPLAIIPFELDGAKLGTLDRLVLERSAPKKITSVRVEVKMTDSLLGEGLRDCRLVADLNATRDPGRGVNVKIDHHDGPMFRCLAAGTTDTAFREFGRAVLQPAGVTIPLLLPTELVRQLENGSFLTDSSDTADSLSGAMEALGDSIQAAAESKADSLDSRQNHLAESLRVVGRHRGDSIKAAALRLADSLKAASLKSDASRSR